MGCEVLVEFVGNVACKDATHGRWDANGLELGVVVGVLEEAIKVLVSEVRCDIRGEVAAKDKVDHFVNVFVESLVFQFDQVDEGIHRVGHEAVVGALFPAADGFRGVSRERVKCCWASGRG